MADGRTDDLLDLLLAAQAQQEAIAADTRALQAQCRAAHGTDSGNDDRKDDTTDAPTLNFLCRPCYDALLGLLHDAYATPIRPQWYTPDRTAWLAALDQRLDDARRLAPAAGLAALEAWCAARQRAWLAAWLRGDVGVQALADTDSSGRAKTRIARIEQDGAVASDDDADDDDADDDNDAFAQLLDDLLALADPAARHDAATMAARLQKAPAHDRAALERALVLGQPADPADAADAIPPSVAAQALAATLRQGTASLGQALSAAAATAAASTSPAPAAALEKSRRRLAELRRAKAAHEAQKRKRLKPVEVPYFLQGTTPCAACARATNPQRSPFCLVCFLEVDYCLRENHTVWCSVACMAAAYRAHMAAYHPCAASARCLRSAASAESPDGPVGPGGPGHGFCRECVLSFSITTFYCSQRCAARDFQHHREKVHVPNREMRADFHDDRADLDYRAGPDGPDHYTATDIAKHILSITDAFASCQKKHPDWQLVETTVQIAL